MTQQLSEEYWNNRYLNNDFGWDVGAVSTPLQTYFDQLKDKNIKILVPGAGNAYEAEYLVNEGFKQVYVCDLAQEPLNNLKKRCPAIPQHHLIKGDFFELQETHFDLIVEQTFFCAINPTLRQKYFEQMHALLAKNGKLVGVMFNDVLNADHPPFGGSQSEYQNYFKHLFDIKSYEACYNSVKPRAGRELFVNLIKK